MRPKVALITRLLMASLIQRSQAVADHVNTELGHNADFPWPGQWPFQAEVSTGAAETSDVSCDQALREIERDSSNDWPGYDRSRPLVTGMASGGMGNRLAVIISYATVAEVLKRPIYVMWNVTDDGSSDSTKQTGLLRGKLLPGQSRGHCKHGCYDWHTFRQSITLPHAMPYLLDEVTNMTAQMYKCIATMGLTNHVSSNAKVAADLQPSSNILPTVYDLKGSAVKEMGDQTPHAWLKRVKSMVKLGLFISQAEWNDAVPDDDTFLQAYHTVTSQIGPSLLLQTCLPEPKAYVAVHLRCTDGDESQCSKGYAKASSMVERLVASSALAKHNWKLMITSNSAALKKSAESQVIESLGSSYLTRSLDLGEGTCLHAGKLDANTFEVLRDYMLFKQASVVLAPLGRSSMSLSAAYAGNTPVFTNMAEFEGWLSGSPFDFDQLLFMMQPKIQKVPKREHDTKRQVTLEELTSSKQISRRNLMRREYKGTRAT